MRRWPPLLPYPGPQMCGPDSQHGSQKNWEERVDHLIAHIGEETDQTQEKRHWAENRTVLARLFQKTSFFDSFFFALGKGR